MARITKRSVEALEPAARDCIVFDDAVKGFGVRVLPSGQKTYLAQYRSGGRTRRVKIGRHGVMTAEEARAKAKELLGAVGKGDNPAQEISDHRRAPTVFTVCERFLREHVAERCKPTTQREYRRVIHCNIKPAIGAFKIGDVTRADISQLHHKLRESPYQANRTLSILSKLFNLAEVWGLRPDGSNPCRHVQKYRERKRERFLSPAELTKLAQALNAAAMDGSESPYAVAAFRLLILTGCRLSEIQKLQWDYVTPGYLILPDSKTGPRRIPLPREAEAIIAALPRGPGNPYVIVSDEPGEHIRNLHHPWRRLVKRARLEHTRIHDLRHTYASNAVMHGVNIVIVSKLLGHTQIQTTMRYAHLADEPVRAAAAEMGSVLGNTLAAPPLPAQTEISRSVIPFPSGRVSPDVN